MKLRNLVLTAALLLTSTFAVADIYEGDDSIVWNNDKPNANISVTLKKVGQTGFQYAVYDTAKYDSLKDSFSFNDLKANPEKYKGSVWLLNEGKNHLYITTAVESLGIIGVNGNSGHYVFSSNNVPAKNNGNGWLFYVDENLEVISFDATKDKGKGNYAAEITFGAPLPAPVVTLLIALGFGAALVMYRNRKQVKA